MTEGYEKFHEIGKKFAKDLKMGSNKSQRRLAQTMSGSGKGYR